MIAALLLVAVCHAGPRADHGCTPGATNPAVTQQTVRTTICVPGWTATVRPPVSYTNSLKRTDMAMYGLPRPASLYELDHLIPLALGGAPSDPRNLWPEPYAGTRGAYVKDHDEVRLKDDVCAGRLTLAAARHKILAEWRD